MKGAQAKDPFGRWGVDENVAPVPPPKCGDYAFLLHMIASLKSKGRGAIILPHGVLFRGNAEGEIRKFIIEKHIISGVIGLPPNLFFGTGIPACIIIIDKGAALTSKGIFMIDAKDGFAKDGAKNRLRECDIRRIVDTWEAQANVPHYARMVLYAEIEKNDFNLNIPRYIAPADKEIRQDIVAHLKGGIPEADAAIYPSALFKRLRKGYVKLDGSADDVAANLEADPETTDAADKYAKMYRRWLKYFGGEAQKMKAGVTPKKLIQEWAGRLLEDAQRSGPFVDAYDVYEILMNYWAETLQDDCYLISRDGWKAELLPPAKKNATWESYVCDLLPVEIVARAKFGEELTSINLLKSHLEEVVQNIAEIDEKLADEESEEEIDEEGLKTTRKALEYSVKQFKKAIKDETETLTGKIVKYYVGLDETAIKEHVIGDKWTATLESRFVAELARVKAKIVADVKSLAARYAVTLPDAERAVDELSAKVAGHLAAMGIEV